MKLAELFLAAVQRTVWLGVITFAAVFLSRIALASNADSDSPLRPATRSENAERSQEGAKQLDELEQRAAQHSCWKHAVESLRSSCADLNDVRQGYLALSLTNCHLEQYGRSTYPCTSDLSLQDCTRGMDGEAFNALSTFTAHTSNICFFLAGQLWQERTERTVNDLSATSQHVVGQLNESAKQNEQLLKMQQSALQNQDALLSNGNQLQNDLELARKEAEGARKEAEAQSEIWQRNFGNLFTVLARNEAWLSTIGTDWMTAKMFLTYTALFIVAIFITNSSMTSGARLPLIALCVAGFLVEIFCQRLAAWWTGDPMVTVPGVNWYIRQGVFLAGAIFLCWTAVVFRDPSKRLERMEKHIEEVHSRLIGGSAQPVGATNGSLHRTTTTASMPNLSPRLSAQQPPTPYSPMIMSPAPAHPPTFNLTQPYNTTGGEVPASASTPWQPITSSHDRGRAGLSMGNYIAMGNDSTDGPEPPPTPPPMQLPSSLAEDSGVEFEDGELQSAAVGDTSRTGVAGNSATSRSGVAPPSSLSHSAARGTMQRSKKTPHRVKSTPKRKLVPATPASQTASRYNLRSRTSTPS
eukprot:scpid61424/ scgid11965/ 